MDSAGSILHISPYSHSSVHIIAGITWPRNQQLISRLVSYNLQIEDVLMASFRESEKIFVTDFNLSGSSTDFYS
jgi:hypothetical protein